ncbi:MAG: GerW family sporulation protein [Ruthenibacterium sp.]
MNEHPIQGLMDVTLEKIKSMVDANTIIGDPINTDDGTLILPISRISYGFASGGSDFPSKTTKDLFGGGGGAGVSVSPVAFLIVKDGNVRMIQLADTSHPVDRAIGLMPEMVDKITGLFQKKKPKQAPADELLDTDI